MTYAPSVSASMISQRPSGPSPAAAISVLSGYSRRAAASLRRLGDDASQIDKNAEANLSLRSSRVSLETSASSPTDCPAATKPVAASVKRLTAAGSEVALPRPPRRMLQNCFHRLRARSGVARQGPTGRIAGSSGLQRFGLAAPFVRLDSIMARGPPMTTLR
jgi:hypothetical protein